MLHLGDDNYSPNSANSGEFRAKSIGPFTVKHSRLQLMLSLKQIILL